MSILYTGKIVGVTFEPSASNFQAIAEKSKNGSFPKLELQAEPNNKYDPQAIAVYADNLQVGYIPKDGTAAIHAFRGDIKAKIVRFTNFNGLPTGLYIEVFS